MSRVMVTIDGYTYEVEVHLSPQSGSEFPVKVSDKTAQVIMPNMDVPLEKVEWIVVGDRPYEIIFDDDLRWINAYSGTHQLDIRDLDALVPRPRSGDTRVKAPIPGLITRVLVSEGQTVEAGEPLVVLEAMKMENEIRSLSSGVVSSLHVAPGQSVMRNEVLAEIE